MKPPEIFGYGDDETTVFYGKEFISISSANTKFAEWYREHHEPLLEVSGRWPIDIRSGNGVFSERMCEECAGKEDRINELKRALSELVAAHDNQKGVRSSSPMFKVKLLQARSVLGGKF